MDWKRLWPVPLIAIAVVSTVLAERHFVHRSRTKPCLPCGIPKHDYQFRDRSPSVISDTATAVLLKNSAAEVEEIIARIADDAETSSERVVADVFLRDAKAEVNTLLAQLARIADMGENGPSMEVVDKLLTEAETTFLELQNRASRDAAGREAEDFLRESRREFGGIFEGLRTGLPREQARRLISEIRIRNDGLYERTTDTIRQQLDKLPAALRPPRRYRSLAELQGKQKKIDVYRLGETKLEIDQCSISGVALQLDEDGGWVLSLRHADQNRRRTAEEVSVYKPRLYVKRNEFVIRLRFLGNYENRPSAIARTAGKPMLAELEEIKFWVENGQPRFYRTTGFNPSAKKHFADIDRVELEFFFH